MIHRDTVLGGLHTADGKWDYFLPGGKRIGYVRITSFSDRTPEEHSPVIDSYYAFCIAKERGQVSKAILLCRESMQKEPNNSVHYLNLGRIQLIENNKAVAIRIFREGLSIDANHQIVEELNKLVIRKPPVIRFLKRSNPANKYLGIILKKLRLR